MDKFIDELGRIKVWPRKLANQLEVLHYLATKFNYNKIYTEKEVNQLINEHHTFNDYFLLRRELIDRRLLKRTPNGASYWKNDLLPTIETERLIIKDSQISDKDELTNVFLSLAYMEEYTGTKHELEYIDKILTTGDLPPNGMFEFYRVKSIFEKERQKIIGFMEYYLGYPNPNTLWIASFLFNKEDQQKNYGTELIHKIISELHEIHSSIHQIGIGVHLKNWQALRFWVKNGFKEIIGLNGDEVYGHDHFSIMGLVKQI